MSSQLPRWRAVTVEVAPGQNAKLFKNHVLGETAVTFRDHEAVRKSWRRGLPPQQLIDDIHHFQARKCRRDVQRRHLLRNLEDSAPVTQTALAGLGCIELNLLVVVSHMASPDSLSRYARST